MSLFTVVVALVLIFLAWKLLKGLVKLALIAVVILVALSLLGAQSGLIHLG